MPKYKWEIGKTYKTVNGCDATLVARLNSELCPLLFVITKADGQQIVCHRNDRGILISTRDCYAYNVVPPELVKTSMFVTAYARHTRNVTGGSYISLEQARRAATHKRFISVLELQYEDDELVNVVIHPAKAEESK